MPSFKTNFSVGLFVIIGITTIIVFVLWLGMSQYFKEGRHYVAFFDESVQGLQKDSAVKYRGVSIGRVESIRVAEDGRLIRILFNLDEPLVDHDKMVARIKSIGITGIMFVELERMDPRDRVWTPEITFKTRFPVIATRPSDMKQLLTDVYEILNKIKQIDIKGISSQIMDTLANANQAIEDADIKETSAKLRNTLDRAGEILDEKKWNPIMADIRETTVQLPALAKAAGTTIEAIDTTVEIQGRKLTATIDQFYDAAAQANTLMENSTLLVNDAHTRVAGIDRELTETLNALETATEAVNNLVRQLADQPSRLLFSAPPTPKPVDTMPYSMD